MTEISFLFLELLFVGIWVLLRIIVWRRKGRIDWKREAVLLLMYINLAVILRFTFFPMDRVDGRIQPLVFDPATAYPFRINLVPLKQLLWFETKRDLLMNLIGNVTMFIPSGIILPILYKKLNSFWKVAGCGLLISLCIEILQLPFSSRGTDVDDLLLNTFGVAVGYGIYALAKRLKRT